MQMKKNIDQKKFYPETDKLCALTFDDGPDNDKTPLVLEKLKAHNVKATFFMVGELINEDTKDLVKKISSSGYEIENHSWNYKEMSKMNKEQITRYVTDTSAIIENYTGLKPQFFRPPNLSTSPLMFESINLPFVGGVLGFDWNSANTSAEDRVNNVLKEMEDGAVILLHDVQPEPHPTPEALDILIPELKRIGYEFVTLSELFKKKNINSNIVEKKLWKYIK